MSEDKKVAMTNSIQPHSIACSRVIDGVRKSGLEWPMALFKHVARIVDKLRNTFLKLESCLAKYICRHFGKSRTC